MLIKLRNCYIPEVLIPALKYVVTISGLSAAPTDRKLDVVFMFSKSCVPLAVCSLQRGIEMQSNTESSNI